MTNPFNKLKVHRDEDEEVDKTQPKGNAPVLFPKDAQKPKKKVRPTEKKEDKPQENVVHEDDKDFVVVGNTKKGGKQQYGREEDFIQSVESKPGVKEQTRPKKEKYFEHDFKNNERLYDRHVSGTGRGKEVKKRGGGGKYTWEGRKVVNDYDNTDYVFNKVLKPKDTKEEVYVEESPQIETKKDEVKKEEEVGTAGDEQKAIETKEGEEVKDRKKKGKKDDISKEEEEKNKLVIPENALTLKEYKEKNTTKITTDTSKTSGKVEIDLEPVEKLEDKDVIGVGKTTDKGAKKQNKKLKVQDAKEVELNKLIGSNLKIEDTADRQYRKDYYGGNKKTTQNTKFKESDFPPLK